jgi:tetratricopeptide (TPR) repeat protein
MRSSPQPTIKNGQFWRSNEWRRGWEAAMSPCAGSPDIRCSANNVSVRFLDRCEHILLVLLTGTVALGGAGSLLGTGWAVAGVLAGPFIALAAAVLVQVFTTTDPALLAADRHREALHLIDREMPGLRLLARVWPGQFRDALANRLLHRSLALHAALRDGEAVANAEEGVAIYRALAANRPAKPVPGLAIALNNLTYPLRAAGRRDEALAAADESVRLNRALATTRPRRYRYSLACSLGTQAELLSQAGRLDDALRSVSEAAGIYQDMQPGNDDASQAAEVLTLQGQILCGLSRYREAARPLAQGWHLATSRQRQNPDFPRAALKTAYKADPAGFAGIWRTETGSDLPRWLTEQDGASPDRPG